MSEVIVDRDKKCVFSHFSMFLGNKWSRRDRVYLTKPPVYSGARGPLTRSFICYIM